MPLHEIVNFGYASKSCARDPNLKRTSSVPLTYHYNTTMPKRLEKQRASQYLSSTTIVPLFFNLTPIRQLTKTKTTSKIILQ